MTLFLTGSPCNKGIGHFTSDGAFLQRLKERLPEHPAILLVSAAPDDPDNCRWVFDSTKECLVNSGIEFSSVRMLARDNAAQAASLVADSDFVILCGGHVPTQNRFFREIGLRDILKAYDGVILACSAGSMNCAEEVYSHPELPGEGSDPFYQSRFEGLGLTDINIVPHLEDISDAWLDGRRLLHDIILPMSYGHRFYTFCDGVYIIEENGRRTLYGEAWVIENGNIRKISERGGSYSFMNLVFISPHFPATYSHFCAGLRANGVNVLGIADAPYDELNEELRNSLTEYYRVNSLENYDEVYRAVAFFTHKYGRIDWIESNNEYWLEQNARLRTDYNITSGIQMDRISSIKEKSEMKKYYRAGGIPTARQIKASEGFDAVKAFAALTGYPIIAKPDNGVGAEGTFKLCNDSDLKDFFESHPSNYGAFVVEEFITGLLVSYDGIYNSKSEPVFESMSVFPTPIMDVVHDNLENCYYVDKTVPKALSDIGRRTVRAFGIKSRFVHLEFFKLDRNREGLGKKGDYVGLEVNMRPAGGFTPDMMDYAHSTDVFRIWADMVAFDECRTGQGEQFYCAYVGRRFGKEHTNSHDDILARYGASMVMCERMPDALSSALGNMVYMARFKTVAEVRQFFKFVTE